MCVITIFAIKLSHSFVCLLHWQRKNGGSVLPTPPSPSSSSFSNAHRTYCINPMIIIIQILICLKVFMHTHKYSGEAVSLNTSIRFPCQLMSIWWGEKNKMHQKDLQTFTHKIHLNKLVQMFPLCRNDQKVIARKSTIWKIFLYIFLVTLTARLCITSTFWFTLLQLSQKCKAEKLTRISSNLWRINPLTGHLPHLDFDWGTLTCWGVNVRKGENARSPLMTSEHLTWIQYALNETFFQLIPLYYY